jgi:hypothetical protein
VKANETVTRQLDQRGEPHISQIFRPATWALRQAPIETEKAMSSSRRLLMLMATVMLSLLLQRSTSSEKR